MSQLSNATLSTLQNTYYDDYNEGKQFYRILFRPAVAVQARELTQLQTAIQKQISRFGDNIFRDGSIVDGCAINDYAGTPYVRLVDSLLTGNVAITDLAAGKYIITNGTTANAVRATVLTAQTGFVSTYPNTNQLYLKYYYTGKDGSNNDVGVFSNGQTLYIYNANQTALGVLNGAYLAASINVFTSNSSTNSTGLGYCLGISEGIVYHKGFFQSVERQITVVKRHDSSPNNMIVGFETEESIVTDSQDASLNDNAQGFTNYNAPGAHRLKLNPKLVPYTKNAVSNTFFGVAEFDNGRLIISRKADQSYNKINEVMSQRTYEESGNYTIRPFVVQTGPVTGNTDAFFYKISPGLAYVKGNRVELLGTFNNQTSRANTTAVDQNQTITANFGNYVYVSEVIGAPDITNVGEVAIYDSAQLTVSGFKGSSGAVVGNVVGYANIKSLLFYSGEKGTPSCKYYLYLTNIRMNKGKSFRTDAKSFYKSSSPRFVGDIILENGAAVLKDTSFTSMVFNSGVPAVKSLTPSGGSVDTTFTFRKTSTTALNGNGTFTFTLSGGLGTGGTEQLYSTNARDYNISLTQNTYTSNITGTASANQTSNVVTGLGTTFQTLFTPGDTVRFSNATASWVRVVGSVLSNTSMTLTSNGGGTYGTYNIQYYYPDGTILQIEDSMLSVNSAANTFSINLGKTIAFGSGNTVYAQYPVQRTLAAPVKKTVKKSRYVKIDCSNNSGGTRGPWSLGLPDVYKIEKVHIGTSYSNTTSDVKEWFRFDTGQRDDVYEHATLSIKPSYVSQINSSAKILVLLSHFEANTAAGAGFFSIDSYPVSNDGISSNSTTIALAEIPFYNSTAGEVYNLRDSIDFRPLKAATANSVANTNYANTLITVNPPAANSNTYSVGAYGQYLPEADSTFTADYEYYLPRRDLIIATPSGRFTVIQGNPELNPRLPLNISDGTVIAETIVPPYPSLTNPEAEAYNRNDIAIAIILRSNKRYTMEEIGVLEDRIKRLEYYTVLNAVEQAAKSLTIPKEDGTDRFKNGIFVETFVNHSSGAVTDPAYSISTYSAEASMRPKFKERSLDLQYVSTLSTNVQKSGYAITLPFVTEDWISQTAASKYRVCTESIWQWNGSIDLLPETDFFKDTTNAPAVNFTVDMSQPFTQNPKAFFGTDYQTLSVDVDTDIASQANTSKKGQTVTTTTTTTATTTTTTQQLATTTSFGGTTKTTAKVGTFVQDVSIVPYIREQLISFTANNLKPNTKLHCFFDKINVDAHVAPGTIAVSRVADASFETKPNYLVTPTAPLGTQLVANSTGGVSGIFKIPDGIFRTGDRDFLITNVDDLDVGESAQITKAQATFSASALSVTKAPLTMTTINPKILVSSKVVTTTDVDVSVTQTSTSIRLPPPPPPPPPIPRPPGGKGDPIAQSFLAIAPPGAEGVYLTQVGLYFKQKDPSLGLTVYIAEMSLGLPDRLNIIGQGFVPSSAVKVSDDASAETVFTLDMPIYLEDNREYAFIVEPQGNSPEPLIWLAETGGIDIATGQNIFKDSYSGVAFVSANMSTWTPIQKEDIKFKLYRARFTALNGTATFRNEDDEYLTVTGLTRANASIGIKVGDVVYSQNSTSNTALVNSSFPFGVVQAYNEAEGTIVLDSARPGFSSVTNPRIEFHRVLPVSNTSLSNSTLVAYANVVSVDNYEYHAFVPKFAFIAPSGTTVTYQSRGTDENYNLDSGYKTVRVERSNELADKARFAVSKTNESLHGMTKSTFVQAMLSSSSEYMSPVIDLRRKGAIIVENIINDDITGEDTNSGNALCRYISKAITLAEGQDAEDIRIYLRAHRPVGTNIYVYGKFKAQDDPEAFDTKKWTLLEYKNATDDIYSSSAASLDWKEYEFGFANTPNTTVSFSPNTAVNSASDYILITNNPFVNNNLVIYEKPGGSNEGDDPTVAGLANSGFYYVVQANATALSLSASQDGTPLTINATTNSTSLHFLRSYLPKVPGTSYLNPDNSNIVEYYNTSGSRYQSYKYFALKVVLTSNTGVKFPKLNDMRAIALQV